MRSVYLFNLIPLRDLNGDEYIYMIILFCQLRGRIPTFIISIPSVLLLFTFVYFCQKVGLLDILWLARFEGRQVQTTPQQRSDHRNMSGQHTNLIHHAYCICLIFLVHFYNVTHYVKMDIRNYRKTQEYLHFLGSTERFYWHTMCQTITEKGKLSNFIIQKKGQYNFQAGSISGF